MNPDLLFLRAFQTVTGTATLTKNKHANRELLCRLDLQHFFVASVFRGLYVIDLTLYHTVSARCSSMFMYLVVLCVVTVHFLCCHIVLIVLIKVFS